MFYPTNDVDEIMPDAILTSRDVKRNPDHKNRMAYFTRRHETLQELVAMKKQAKLLETKILEFKRSGGVKGTLPQNIMMHPSIAVGYKHGTVILNGLDNATNIVK